MKHCDHTQWLNLYTQGEETWLAVSDRLQKITKHIPNPSTRSPSLFVLIGNRAKHVALKELFGVRRDRHFSLKRNPGEIHLHVDPSSVFHGRPVLIAEGDLPSKGLTGKIPTSECHEITWWTVQRPSTGFTLEQIATSTYSQLLFPFADAFCFFSEDLGGFKQIARQLAVWLLNDQTSTLPKSTHPRVVIVTEKIPLGAEIEAKKAFVWLLSEETTKDLSNMVSAIDIVALFPNGSMSVDARHRLLKERLLTASDQVRRDREDRRLLFSTTHFAGFIRAAYEHLSKDIDKPFNFITASRAYNRVAVDLDEHLSNFLKHIKSSRELIKFAAPLIASSFLLDSYPPSSHAFSPKDVFELMYRDVLLKVSKGRVISFEDSKDVILRSGFLNLIKKEFEKLYEEMIEEATPASEIHDRILKRFEDRWCNIYSTRTCLHCLRRTPQYSFSCKHIVCENCVLNFADSCEDDPSIFKLYRCLLCGQETTEEVTVKVHPPTAGVGVLCLDGGGTRGVMTLKLMKRIQDRIGLPIPFQKLFKMAFGISSGGLIILAMFLNGWSIEDSTEAFEKLASLAFKRRKISNIPFLPNFLELLISYFADGLYPPENIEAALKQVFGTERSILDFSYASSTGTRVGLPAATVNEKPSRCIFTNYNGVGDREKEKDYVVKPKEGAGRIRLWEIARCASAALGFFPPKHIHGIGSFQDAGPLENDPVVSALSEMAVIFPSIEKPDFVLSLGTGEPPASNTDLVTETSPRVKKKNLLHRLGEVVWEKWQDKIVRDAIQARPNPDWYHRLNVKFDSTEPRLDDTKSIPELKAMAQDDYSLSQKIDDAARCITATFFYFELDSIPEMIDGKYVGSGHILCTLENKDRAFQDLINQLSACSTQLLLNESPISLVNDPSCFSRDGSFRKPIQLNVDDRFKISLKEGKCKPWNISGSPFSVRKLVIAQKLDASFGTADHRKRKASNNIDYPRKRQRYR